MGLKDYRKKRDFSHTPEPSGKTRASKKSALPIFVIQKHAASHLHYDFRLEMEGVLKSWAVPKGPSLNPADKRLAVHVEDHPFDYANFEGIIPAGEYGGGTVMVWDMGHWEAESDAKKAYRQGKLVFTLYGKKLQGKWTLVKMQGAASSDGKNWLLIKYQDEFASTTIDVTESEPLSALTDRSMETIKAESS